MPNTYIGEAPPNTDNCQWVKLLGGRSRVHFGKDTYDYPRLSVCARDKKNQKALEIIMQMYHILQNYTDANDSIIITRTPYFTGRDLLDRSVYSFQIEIQLGGY